MSRRRTTGRRAALRTLAALALAGVARAAPPVAADARTRDALAGLDPQRIPRAAVDDVLSACPAPRIVLLQGSVPIVTMAPFARFLIAMGYPAERIADPRDGSLSASSFADSARLAGTLAWHYEQDGVRPIVIGHSQGGMLAVRVLHELSGAFHDRIAVVDPLRDAPLARTTIQDPWRGDERGVVGLSLPYAAAIATGRLFRVLLGQWSMLERLSRIPDSVDAFTGFSLPGDLIGAGAEPYAATGRARVRNVVLPSHYSHIGLPRVDHLAADANARAWIDGYVPDEPSARIPDAAPFDTVNLLHAADVWHSVKACWCSEAQRAAGLVRPS